MAKLILLPGADGTGKFFEPIVNHLSLKCEVVSLPNQEALSYSELEKYVSKQLPTGSPFVLLGESFSGPIAISLAAAGIPALKGLILCASFARTPRPGLAWLAPLVAMAPWLPPGWLLEEALMGSYATTDLRDRLLTVLASVPLSVLKHRLREVLGVDYGERLKAVTVPSLYLRATHDRLVPAAAARHFAENSSAGEVVDVEGPHFLLQCNPSESAREIERFVSNVASSPH